MAIKVGINGFGRIGRMVFRAAVKNFANDIQIVGINDLLDPEYLAYMLKYDSVHGIFDGTIEVDGSNLIVNGNKIRLTQEMDPANLNGTKSVQTLLSNLPVSSSKMQKPANTSKQAQRKSSCLLLPKTQLPCSSMVLTTKHTQVRTSSPTHLAQPTAWHRSPKF
jgi:glyceraldehyde-3-phosphate dehydrogenase/erythrose-4-phosphate dehydrogenase